LAASFDDAFILMSVVTVIGMGLALFLRDPVLEANRKAGGIMDAKTGAMREPEPAGVD
jgi:hypothetical protein